MLKTWSVLLLRLNEKMFKPLFLILQDWAQLNEEQSTYNMDRSIFFFKLVATTSQELKVYHQTKQLTLGRIRTIL